MRDYMDRRVTLTKRATSPTWGRHGNGGENIAYKLNLRSIIANRLLCQMQANPSGVEIQRTISKLRKGSPPWNVKAFSRPSRAVTGTFKITGKNPTDSVFIWTMSYRVDSYVFTPYGNFTPLQCNEEC